jgi:hypothetical protein
MALARKPLGITSTAGARRGAAGSAAGEAPVSVSGGAAVSVAGGAVGIVAETVGSAARVAAGGAVAVGGATCGGNYSKPNRIEFTHITSKTEIEITPPIHPHHIEIRNYTA